MGIKKELKAEKLELGVCYYPEHWDKSLWQSDLERMQQNGITTIRIGEFAWSIFEPNEGDFTFEFFDEFLTLVEKTDIKVIFGTPTATPPAWLTTKYPEVLNADKEGNLFHHGCRRHYNYNSKVYNELCAKIVEQLAIHYGNHPNIIGWQIDNEFNCESSQFYSDADKVAFVKFLKDKYVNLDALNSAWGAVFWNQTYSDWSQVDLPRKVNCNTNNLHQMLDYFRFISDSVCRFAKLQSDILRKYIRKDMYITHNGMFENIDNHRLTEESLDFYMYDNYPNFGFDMGSNPNNKDGLHDRWWSKNLSEVRSVSNLFGIMEQQSGPNGWNNRMEAPAPKPGQLTLWTMQAVAHGADFISYFRWRTCTQGTEIYWHGILDYSNRDNRRLKEVGEVSRIFEKLEEVAGSRYKAKVGVLKDYDNIWDKQIDNWHSRVANVSEDGIFTASQHTQTPIDFVYLRENTVVEDLASYEFLFYPHASIMTEKRADLIKEYVSNGGKIIFGSRTAYKDITGKCPVEKLPWLLRDLTGTDITEYTLVGPFDEDIEVNWDNFTIDAPVFNDILEPLGKNSKVLGTFENNYYKGSPAFIENTFGEGKAYYFGGAFNKNTTIKMFEKFGLLSPYGNVIELPQECELAIRVKDGVEYIFVLNYAWTSTQVNIKEELFNMYNNEKQSGVLQLKPYETVVFKRLV